MRYKTIKNLALVLSALFIASALFAGVASVQGKQPHNKNPKPVSYTHLTLPTN